MNPKKIIQILQNNKFEAYYIGGFVRDKLLNKKSLDADIVTSARPEEIINIFSGLSEVKEVGKSFGVVIVNNIEVATYRKDRYNGLNDKDVNITYSDTLKEDTDRRDLTINALAMDNNNKIIDYHNGIKDLNNRIIKFIGSPKKRILEDPNRILRACRFRAAISGTFDPCTFFALKQHKNIVKYIKPERINKEIMKAMTIPNASDFFIALYQIGVLEIILPSLFKCVGVSQNRFHTEPVFYHNMKCGDSISTKYPLLKLTGYLHDIGKVSTKKYNEEIKDYQFLKHHKVGAEIIKLDLEKLRFSNDNINYIYNLIYYHMRSNPEKPKGFRRTMNLFRENNVDIKDHIRLKLADRNSKYPVKKYTISEIKYLLNGIKVVINNKQPFGLKDLKINGNNIMTILDCKPSPLIGKILNKLLNIVIDNPELNTIEYLKKEVENSERLL